MLKQNEPWFGASSDSFVSCSCCGKDVVEVKCPLALKVISRYNMYVWNLPYCDFVVWTPKEFLSTRITIDTEFMAVITEKCFNLLKEAIVPELLCRTMDKSDDDQNGERKFCICKETWWK